MYETRDNFQRLFIKEKVLNQGLDIEPLIQFKDKLESMGNKLGILSQ